MDLWLTRLFHLAGILAGVALFAAVTSDRLEQWRNNRAYRQRQRPTHKGDR